MHRHALSLIAAVALAACSQPAAPPGSAASDAAPADVCAALSAANVDDCLRLNQLQLLGTHNSYHVAPEPPVLALLGERAKAFEYTHQTLTHQLDALGVRQFEIDVFVDPEGGRYAKPAILAKLPPGATVRTPGPEMSTPGFKVLHVQDVDVVGRCSTLDACLREIRDWSRAHPRHVPIMVMLELKESDTTGTRPLGPTDPLPFDAAQLDALDAAVRAVFDEDHLLTPDDVRGAHATLREALAQDGWPRLRDVRGKVLFAMDNSGGPLERYLDGHPSLEGRVLFVSAEPGTPASAFLKLNEVMGDEQSRITDLARAGYIIRTRADLPTIEARTGDTTRRDRAFASGAQFVSTDYPEVSPFGSGYVARLPGAETLPARCNPVTAPETCRAEWLEPASR